MFNYPITRFPDYQILFLAVLAALVATLAMGLRPDSFYAGEVNPMPGGFWQSRMDHVIEDLTRAKVANFEMEAATIFTLAQLFGFMGGIGVLFAYAGKGKRELPPSGVIVRITTAQSGAVGKFNVQQ